MHEQIRTCTLRSNDLERHWNLEAELSVCHTSYSSSMPESIYEGWG